jgi:hypothetical protein
MQNYDYIKNMTPEQLSKMKTVMERMVSRADTMNEFVAVVPNYYTQQQEMKKEYQRGLELCKNQLEKVNATA